MSITTSGRRTFKYTKFSIANYRAMTEPLLVDIEDESLMPIIVINESGKTTILHAIFAFDYMNDNLPQDGQHPRDTQNIYRIAAELPKISAEIEIGEDEFDRVLEDIKERMPGEHAQSYLDAAGKLGGRLWVTRISKAAGTNSIPPCSPYRKQTTSSESD